MQSKEVIEKLKTFWKKFWFLLWKDESWKGWVVSLIVLFIFIKFIFFPGLSLITGTSLPLAIVESCSMYHQSDVLGNWNNWWTRHEEKYLDTNINETEFEDFPMQRGFNKGDILFITGKKTKNIQVGDIIIFQAPTTNPVIHRVIQIDNTSSGLIFHTLGDNNNGQLSFENSISENQIIGVARFKIIPLIGWIKLIFYEPLKPQPQKGFCSEN